MFSSLIFLLGQEEIGEENIVFNTSKDTSYVFEKILNLSDSIYSFGYDTRILNTGFINEHCIPVFPSHTKYVYDTLKIEPIDLEHCSRSEVEIQFNQLVNIFFESYYRNTSLFQTELYWHSFLCEGQSSYFYENFSLILDNNKYQVKYFLDFDPDIFIDFENLNIDYIGIDDNHSKFLITDCVFELTIFVLNEQDLTNTSTKLGWLIFSEENNVGF